MTDIVDWLKLWRVPEIGAARFRKLLLQFGQPAQALAASDRQWRELGMPEAAIAQRHCIPTQHLEADYTWLMRPDCHVLRFTDADYPALLSELTVPPPLLFVRGNLAVLNQPQVAIVGTRNPSQEGGRHALDFAATLAASGLHITSGLALGVDGAAHQGALNVSQQVHAGRTIAVLGTGPDRIYPARHRDLATAILEQGGALVSEFSPGTPPQAENFPRRNRIISGLTLGTLVVEAARRSGSLITAKYALEQGREVFAIPGSIQNTQARGCHQLIKEGAQLVECAQDVMQAFKQWMQAGTQTDLFTVEKSQPQDLPIATVANPPTPAPDSPLFALWQYLADGAKHIDQLAELSGLSAQTISQQLLMLEIEGFVMAQAGGRFIQSK